MICYPQKENLSQKVSSVSYKSYRATHIWSNKAKKLHIYKAIKLLRKLHIYRAIKLLWLNSHVCSVAGHQGDRVVVQRVTIRALQGEPMFFSKVYPHRLFTWTSLTTAGTPQNTLLSDTDGLLHWIWRNWWAVSIDQRRFSLLIQLWDIQRVLVSIERSSSAYYGRTIQSSRRTQTSTTKASENLFCLETFQLSSHLSAIVGAKWENLLLASNRPPASD